MSGHISGANAGRKEGESMCESCKLGGKPWALVYARVSTPGQEEDGSSLDTQVAECLRLANSQHPICGVVTEDKSRSRPPERMPWSARISSEPNHNNWGSDF